MSAILPNRSADLPLSGGRAKFPRSSRLLRHADFQRVYKQGQRQFSSHMTVFYLRRAPGALPESALTESGSRVGFTVGRGMKRRLREAVRMHGAAASTPVDVVINPKQSLLGADFRDLREEISRAFAVIGKSVGKR